MQQGHPALQRYHYHLKAKMPRAPEKGYGFAREGSDTVDANLTCELCDFEARDIAEFQQHVLEIVSHLRTS